MKPYSKACDNNRVPILNEIAPLFQTCKHVLEIGSGTGQHAVFFVEQIPTLQWQTSDCIENHAGIIQWIEESHLSNIEYPIKLDVTTDAWPGRQFDAVFTANTCHIMHWHEVVAMFKGVRDILSVGGLFVIYGPFNYQNNYSSESNERFDRMLRERDPGSGLRNYESIILLAKDNSLEFINDVAMPANNRLLVLKRV
jgi:cyclopropane fatty-acyl-phospholipid synthase-like methyltransferase